MKGALTCYASRATVSRANTAAPVRPVLVLVMTVRLVSNVVAAAAIHARAGGAGADYNTGVTSNMLGILDRHCTAIAHNTMCSSPELFRVGAW